MTDQTFLLVGGGLAAAKAAETLRGEGFEGRIVLVGGEERLPYERPPLSKEVLLGTKTLDAATVHPRAWYDDHDVELRLGTRAQGLAPATHELELDGGERLRYDRLLLATGAVPRRLQVPGADLDGVLALRDASDAERLSAAIRRVADGSGRLAVVGGGWIGLEASAAARHHGCEVTVVVAAALPLQRVLGDEMAGVFADLHREHGVDLRLRTGVRELRGDRGRVTGLVTDRGDVVEATAVLVGVGVTPAVELALSAGLDVDNGVLVDASLRTSDPDVFAAGDIANAFNPLLGHRVRVEHWANALNGGPAAARAMLGQNVVYDPVPYFYSDQYDLGMEYAGWAPPGRYDDVVVRGDLDGREFVTFWRRGGRVVAGMNVNIWGVTDDIQALVRSQVPVDAAALSDPGLSLADLV